LPASSPLAAFLPPHLLLRLGAGGGPPALPCGERFEAALLYSDISGFTALTERLEQRGRHGAEQIAELINAAFEPAVEALLSQGASITSFGGDALLSLFCGGDGASRALAAARQVQECLDGLDALDTGLGPAELGVSQALHLGTVHSLHLGTAMHRHHLATGPSLTALARLQDRTPAGQVRLSPAARAGLNSAAAAAKGPRPGCRPAVACEEALLRRYLPPGIEPLLGQLASEYRKTAVLFLETHGWSLGGLQGFFTALVDVLQDYGGLLLKSDVTTHGTKWLCLFGLPAAQEDDADRAARCVLELRVRLPGRLQWRAGLHSGTVVPLEMGGVSRRQLDVMGDAVNTAARVLSCAAWGEALGSETFRSALHAVQSRPRGEHRVKGKSETLRLHALQHASRPMRSPRVLVPLVGRTAEMARLQQVLHAARDGRGGAVGLCGEAGVGKSRLGLEAMRLAESMGFEVHRAGAVSFGSSPYRAAGELLRSIFGLAEDEHPEKLLLAVERQASMLGLDPTDRHHLAEMLGVRFPDSPLRHLDPPAIRLNNTLALRACLLARARERPQLYVLEDLHWADELTHEAIAFAARQMDPCRTVLLLLYRPGYRPLSGVEELTLGEMGAADVTEILRALLGSDPPRVVLELVLKSAEGNPLYVEELLRHLLECGVLQNDRQGCRVLREPAAELIPASIELLIAARLDRLAPEVRRTAQLGAVIGRSFLFRLLWHFDQVRPHAAEALGELEVRQIIFEKQRDPELEYVFKHALIREVAYQGILVRRRRELHRTVAMALESRFPEARAADLALLGHHWEHAGEAGRARTCYLEAARQAGDRYALDAAEQLYRAALRPPGTLSADMVLARIGLAWNVLAVLGRLAEALDEQTRALELARELGDPAVEARALAGLGGIYANTGRMAEASLLFEQARRLARELGERRYEALLAANLAEVQARLGHLERSEALYEEALGLHRGVGDRRMEGRTLMNLAVLRFDQGRQHEAFELEVQALAIHREVGDLRFEGIVLSNMGGYEAQRGQLEAAGELLRRALQIARSVGDRRSEVFALANLSSMSHEQGCMAEGRALLAEALAGAREIADPHLAHMFSRDMAAQQRRAGAEPEAVGRWLEQAEAGLQHFESGIDRGLWLCQRGHLELARGASAAGWLTQAERLAGELRHAPESQLRRAIGALARAQSDFEANRPLVIGECEADLPEGVRQALRAGARLA
jgi:class 3 adenylate cyclase/tetratricopeptide (TPR) repeat protein